MCPYIHACGVFFHWLSKVSYWCIVGSFGKNRMQKGISESLLHNWKLHQKADGRGFSQLWMEHIWTFCSEQAELQMNAECGAASHLWRAEDPLNLPQRDLVALMILNLVLKIFPFLLLLVLLLSTSPPTTSSLFLHKSLILLTSTTCPGRLLENSGIYFCPFNNSIYIKKKTPSCVKWALAPRALQKKQKSVERWPQNPCLRLTCGDQDVPITDYSFSWLHKVETCCLCI